MDNKNTEPSKENRPVRLGNAGSVPAGGEVKNDNNTRERVSDERTMRERPAGPRISPAEKPQSRRQYFARPAEDDLALRAERSRIGANPNEGTVSRQQNPASAQVPPMRQTSQVNPARQTPPTGTVRPTPGVDPRVQMTGDGRTPQVGQRPMPLRSAEDIADEAAKTKQVPIVSQNENSVNSETATEEVEKVSKDDTQVIDDSVKTEPKIKKTSKRKIKIKKSRADKERSESGNTVLSLVKCMAYITAVFAVSIAISVAVIFAANDMYGFVKSEEAVEVEIPKDATVADVAEILYNNKIIKYKWLFNLKEGDSKVTIQPGTYMLVPKSSYSDLLAAVSKQPPAGVSWITIPEGYTTDEIIDLLVASGIGERDKYIDVINNYDFDYWFIDEIDEDWVAYGRTYRLDGYLFPDTYQFYNASTEVAVINKLLARFNQVFIKAYRNRTEEIGFATDETLSLASLIEKEAGAANYLENCFGNVSSVFHNRLKSSYFSHLQSDATTAYVIHHEAGVRVKLKGSDLDNIISEYNTETKVGLTPGAIANSGNSAILAAMHPSDTGYYFFFSPSNPKPGEDRVIFSKTIEEHNAVVARYTQ